MCFSRTKVRISCDTQSALVVLRHHQLCGCNSLLTVSMTAGVLGEAYLLSQEGDREAVVNFCNLKGFLYSLSPSFYSWSYLSLKGVI